MSLDSQVDGAAVHERVDAHDRVNLPSGVDGHDAVARRWVDSTRVAELEATIAQLREGMVSRQQLGVVTGIVATKLEVTPDEGWAVLVRLSQDTNVKVREVGRVILDAYSGRLAEEDEALATLLVDRCPEATNLLVPYDCPRR
jgi:hypothetical protein